MKTETAENSKTQMDEEEVKKLMIDRLSDFRFHAAYMAYSETWDKTSSRDTKTELNEIMLSLSKEEMSYSNFYKSLDQFRRSGAKHYDYRRKRIETQRKRDWRKKRARAARNSRYRGRT